MRVAGLVGVALFALPGMVTAEPERLGRYSLVHERVLPQASSNDPMAIPVHVELTSDIQTVRQALERVLEPSGYRLANEGASCPSYPALLNWPLPALQRHLVAARLDGALEQLAGPAHYLVLDPVHRLVSFEVREAYAEWANRASTASVKPSVSPVPTRLPEPAGVSMPRAIGPIEEASQLKRLAQAFADEFEATPNQLMLALFRVNPQSFCYHNFNCLRTGTTLTVPPMALIKRHSAHAAKQILHQHYTAWHRRVHKAHGPITPEEVNS